MTKKNPSQQLGFFLKDIVIYLITTIFLADEELPPTFNE